MAAPRACAQSSLGEEVVPDWQLAPDLALGQFQQEHGERLGDRLQIVERQQAIRLADRDPAQAVQPLIRVALMEIEMVPGVHSDIGASPAFRPDPERDLLCQRTARQKDRRLFPQQLGDLRLEPVDQFALAVAVGGHVGVGRLGQLPQDLAR